jgi:hypothetical protein
LTPHLIYTTVLRLVHENEAAKKKLDEQELTLSKQREKINTLTQQHAKYVLRYFPR